MVSIQQPHFNLVSLGLVVEILLMSILRDIVISPHGFETKKGKGLRIWDYWLIVWVVL